MLQCRYIAVIKVPMHMKKVRLLLGVAAALPVLSLSPVYAETTSTGSTAGTGNGTSSGGVNSTATTPKTTQPTTASSPEDVKKRIEEHKTTLKTKLDEATKKRIQLKCKAAQVTVAAHEKVFVTLGDSRSKVYDKLLVDLQKLATRLKDTGKDTTEIDADLKVAAQKVQTLKTEFKNYQQVVADVQAVDCATDPTGFKATLDAARTEREAIRKAAEDLHTYIKSTLKPAFDKFKTASTGSSQSRNATGTTTPPTNSDAALTSKVPAAGRQ